MLAAKSPESGRPGALIQAVSAIHKAAHRDLPAVFGAIKTSGIGATIHSFATIQSWPMHAPIIRKNMGIVFPQLLLELSERGLIDDNEMIRWLPSPDFLMSLRFGGTIHLEAMNMVEYGNRRLKLQDKSGKSSEISLNKNQARYLPRGFLFDPSFFPINSSLWLALRDINPLAMEETHPEKSGNAPNLGGRNIGEWRTRLLLAFKTIGEVWPELGEEISILIDRIIPVGYHKERHLSASYREAIGTIYLSLSPDLLIMIAGCIHEFQHNKINLASYHDPLLLNAFQPFYKSPIRPDPRPLWGVLLAVHAFLPVAAFYRRLIEIHHPLSRQIKFNHDLHQIDIKNNAGIALLSDKAKWTPTGHIIMSELKEINARHMAKSPCYD
ncbi:MAG: aKG-HExxH-type peptide beta-hydroxylase [Elusimicrobiota bacterium]